MQPHVLGTVQLRVGVEPDQRPFADGPFGDEQGQVVDRPDGQHAGGAGAAGEVEVVVVAHDVDDDTREAGRVVGHVQFTGELFTGESAVPQGAAHFGGDGPNEIADCHVGCHGQAQRQDVGGHADDVPHSAGPAVGGEAQGDFLHSGDPADVCGDRADEDGAPGGAVGGGEPAQTVEDGDGQRLAGVQPDVRPVEDRRWRSIGASADEHPATVRVRFAPGTGRTHGAVGDQVREPVGPVDTVGLVPVRAEIGHLVGNEIAQGCGGQLGFGELLASHGTPVEVGHGAGEDGTAEAIDDYVVEAHVPVVQSGTETQQREVVVRGVEPVGGGHVVDQVALGLPDRILGVGQVDHAEPADPGRGATDYTLADGLVTDNELHVEAVAQGHSPVERCGEQQLVEASTNLEALRDVVLRTVRIDQLSVPDALLSRSNPKGLFGIRVRGDRAVFTHAESHLWGEFFGGRRRQAEAEHAGAAAIADNGLVKSQGCIAAPMALGSAGILADSGTRQGTWLSSRIRDEPRGSPPMIHDSHMKAI